MEQEVSFAQSQSCTSQAKIKKITEWTDKQVNRLLGPNEKH